MYRKLCSPVDRGCGLADDTCSWTIGHQDIELKPSSIPQVSGDDSVSLTIPDRFFVLVHVAMSKSLRAAVHFTPADGGAVARSEDKVAELSPVQGGLS